MMKKPEPMEAHELVTFLNNQKRLDRIEAFDVKFKPIGLKEDFHLTLYMSERIIINSVYGELITSKIQFAHDKLEPDVAFEYLEEYITKTLRTYLTMCYAFFEDEVDSDMSVPDTASVIFDEAGFIIYHEEIF